MAQAHLTLSKGSAQLQARGTVNIINPVVMHHVQRLIVTCVVYT